MWVGRLTSVTCIKKVYLESEEELVQVVGRIGLAQSRRIKQVQLGVRERTGVARSCRKNWCSYRAVGRIGVPWKRSQCCLREELVYIGGIIGVAQRKISVAQSINGCSSEAECLWLGGTRSKYSQALMQNRRSSEEQLIWFEGIVCVALEKNECGLEEELA